MSDTFKFLKQQAEGPKDQPFAPAGQAGSDAAQDFLAKQMAKNKFLDTAQPIENVGKHTTTDPYAYGEGTVPGGEGYKDQQTVLNQKEIDAWHAANPDYEKGSYEGGVDMKPRFNQHGEPNQEKYTIDEIRERFGLVYDEAREAKGFKASEEGKNHMNNANEIWYETNGGEMKLLGYKEGGLMGLTNNSELIQARKTDIKHFGTENEFNSESDVANQIRYMTKKGKKQTKEPPKKKMGIKPIEHSQEIKQAKERVKTYEQGIESGQTSKEIFGNASFMDKYQQDFSKGAEGIGTNAASSGQESANSATQSFLDNKVSQVKKTLSPA